MFRMARLALLTCLCVAGCDRASPPDDTTPVKAGNTAFPASRAGAELVGTPAPALAAELRWLNSDPLSLDELRGKVVLVRFWTDTCPFCEASAPGLTRLHERYGPDGLVVVGVFHPKPRGAVRDLEGVKARAEQLGMEFPIATDSHWDTLERWWLSSGDRAATSVSFLLDTQGTIRWIHPGPEFHPDGPDDHEQCRRDYDDAVRAIEALLAERDNAEKKVG